MFPLFLSILFLLLCLGGVIFTLSSIINTYQNRKMEYVAYKNQSRNPTNTGFLESEEDFYKSKNVPIPKMDKIQLGSFKNLLDKKSYLSWSKQKTEQIKNFFIETDFKLILSKARLNFIKSINQIQTKVLSTWNLVLSLSQPVEEKKMPTVEDLSKMPSLGFNGEKNESSSKDNSKNLLARQSIFPKRLNSGTTASVTRTSSTSIQDENSKVYAELESELLDKLQNNMANFSIWEALGNFYHDHQESTKSKEVYNYILEHSESMAQKIRIRKKMTE
jgi:hypothetical protein